MILNRDYLILDFSQADNQSKISKSTLEYSLII